MLLPIIYQSKVFSSNTQSIFEIGNVTLMYTAVYIFGLKLLEPSEFLRLPPVGYANDRKIAMSIVNVQIPDSLHKSLSDLAERDGISIDRFISTAIAEKLSVGLVGFHLRSTQPTDL